MRQRNESKWRLWDDGRRVSTKIPLATERNGMENVRCLEEGVRVRVKVRCQNVKRAESPAVQCQ